MTQHQNQQSESESAHRAIPELPEGVKDPRELVMTPDYDTSAEEVLGNPAVTPQMSTLQPGDLRHDLKKEE